MDPYRIYRDQWAKALAMQATATNYTTFVAMPFHEHFSYRSRDILCTVIGAAVDEANHRADLRRRFARPERVRPRGASVISDEIITGILDSHFFLADLSFENAGVLLETGIALALKPARQIILITQGSHDELHFDVRNNHVICYNPTGALTEIADAFVGAARHFEEQVEHHIGAVKRRLSPDAIVTLNSYGQMHRLHPGLSLHAGNRGPRFQDADGVARFDAATRELRDRDLLWTDYAVGAIPGGDAYGMHATELGWAVIENMWPELRRVPPAT